MPSKRRPTVRKPSARGDLGFYEVTVGLGFHGEAGFVVLFKIGEDDDAAMRYLVFGRRA